MKLSQADLRIFIKERIEADLNGTPEAEIQRWVDNCTYSTVSGYDMIDDGAHAYLIVPFTDRNYKIAKKCASSFSTRYTRFNGTLMLEEDQDATKFLAAIADQPEYGKQYSLTGGHGQPSIAGGNTWAESEVKPRINPTNK